MRHTVFISYSSIDSRKVDELVLTLQQLDVNIIRDVKDIHVSHSIADRIERLVKSSGTVLVALSNNSIAAPWVEKEVSIASEFISAGAPLKVAYVKINKDTHVPDFIKKQLFIDFSDKKTLAKEIIKLSKIFVHSPAIRQIGIYDAFYGNEDLDRFRERSEGESGCTLSEYISCARTNIVAVGLWFGAIFEMDRGAAISNCLRNNSELKVELFVPDGDKISLDQLQYIHEDSDGVVHSLRAFIELYKKWGENRRLSKSESDRISLRYLPFVPTCSYLCIDPFLPQGRIIVDFFAPSIAPTNQLKLELRGPDTHVYSNYLKSLQYIMSQSSSGPPMSFI
jgi:TIR domain-containing protein